MQGLTVNTAVQPVGKEEIPDSTEESDIASLTSFGSSGTAPGDFTQSTSLGNGDLEENQKPGVYPERNTEEGGAPSQGDAVEQAASKTDTPTGTESPGRSIKQGCRSPDNTVQIDQSCKNSTCKDKPGTVEDKRTTSGPSAEDSGCRTNIEHPKQYASTLHCTAAFLTDKPQTRQDREVVPAVDLYSEAAVDSSQGTVASPAPTPTSGNTTAVSQVPEDAQLKSMQSRLTALESEVASLTSDRASLLETFTSLPSIQQALKHAPTSLSGESAPILSSSPSQATQDQKDGAALQLARDALKRHISLLHTYNEIKDIGQGLMGMIAEQRGVRVIEVQEGFGIEEGD